MIKITRELSKVRHEGILNVYEKMITDDDIDQLGYVNGKILQKIAILENSEVEMERYISAYAKIIFEILKYETDGQPVEYHHKCMLSALYYLCDPFDYIPDVDQDEGYIDDALVINQCLTILKKQSQPTYKHINNFIMDSNI